MRNKRIVSFLSMVLTISLSLSGTFAAKDDGTNNDNKVVDSSKLTINVNNKDYSVDIKDAAKGRITEAMIKNIIEKEPEQGDVTIYEVGDKPDAAIETMGFLPYFEFVVSKTYSMRNSIS